MIVQVYHVTGSNESEENIDSMELDYFVAKDKLRECLYFGKLIAVEHKISGADYLARKDLIHSSFIAYSWDSGAKSFLLPAEIIFLQQRANDILKQKFNGTFLEAAWIDGLLNSLEMGEETSE